MRWTTTRFTHRLFKTILSAAFYFMGMNYEQAEALIHDIAAYADKIKPKEAALIMVLMLPAKDGSDLHLTTDVIPSDAIHILKSAIETLEKSNV